MTDEEREVVLLAIDLLASESCEPQSALGIAIGRLGSMTCDDDDLQDRLYVAEFEANGRTHFDWTADDFRSHRVTRLRALLASGETQGGR